MKIMMEKGQKGRNKTVVLTYYMQTRVIVNLDN